MKLILTIFLGVLLNVSPAFAGKVYLLTSLKVDKKPLFSRASWDFNKKLEKIFKKKTTDFNYEIVIKHKVTPLELQKILTDEKTMGVFWVSHGSRDAIKDMYGNNVKTLFWNLNKNMKFLALVSCNGDYVLEELKDFGLKKKYPNLITLGDSSKVSGAHFLRKSIKTFRYFQNIEIFKSIEAPKLNNKMITLTRKLIVDSKDVLVKLDDKFILGVFPSGKAGDEQRLDIEYSSLIENKLNRRDIVLSRSFKGMTKFEFGNISIHSPDLLGHWELFALPNGLPLGKNALYEYIE